jgi:imidazolonepropionase
MIAIEGCSELVTLAGPARPRTGGELRNLAIVRDGALLIAGSRIQAVGTRAEIEPQMPAGCELIDAGGRIVMPGFVDAHTHPVFAGNRADEFELRAVGATYRQIAERGGGIRSTVRRTRAASEDDLFAAASRYAGWFLRSGTTTIEAKSGYGLSAESELKLLSVIRRLDESGRLRTVPTFLGAHEVPDEYRGRRGDYMALVIDEMLPRVIRGRLAEYCDIFSEPGVFSSTETERILTAARRAGLGLRMHADQLSNSGGAALAARLGAATADHLEQTDLAGIEAMRQAGVQPVLLPGSVYALGSDRYADARAMIDAGLAVVLATDFNPGSSPTPSMPMILSLAVTHMKMTPAEAISAATVNAAYSLGRGGEIGSLEAGKLADIVIHDCEDHREIAYFFGMEHARTVFLGGRRVYDR